MKRLALAVTFVLVGALLAACSRNRPADPAPDTVVNRAAAEERGRRHAAEEEARRLSALQAQQAADEAARAVAELRQQQEAANRERAAAEAEAVRLAAELERLRQERVAALTAADASAEARAGDIAKISAAENKALDLLQTLETEKSQRVDRDAARERALAHQLEVEKDAEERAARFRATRPR